MLQPKKRPRAWVEYEKRLTGALDTVSVSPDATVIVVHASMEQMRFVPGMTLKEKEIKLYDMTMRYLVEHIERGSVEHADASIEALCHLDVLIENLICSLCILQRPSKRRKTVFLSAANMMLALRRYVADALARIGAEPPVEVQKDLSA